MIFRSSSHDPIVPKGRRCGFEANLQRRQNKGIKEPHIQQKFDEFPKITGKNSFLTYINYYIVCAHNFIFSFADSIFRCNFALERLKRAPACSRRPLSFEYEDAMHVALGNQRRAPALKADTHYFLRARMLRTLSLRKQEDETQYEYSG